MRKGEVISIYDADNRPDPNTMLYLIANLVKNPDLGAVLGKVRTINARENLLTRFINIEFIYFQWIVQGGRFNLFRLSTLPGTNYVIWRKALDDAGGLDEDAIAEDAELSFRLYNLGYKIKFVPYAVTWEQEPQQLKVFIKQRTRWAQGMSYIIKKFLKQAHKMKSKRILIDLAYMFVLYYVFFAALIVSDVIAILSVTGVINLGLIGPFHFIWFLAAMLFIVELLLAISFEEEESFSNILLCFLMYVTYCQLWIIIVVRGMYLDMRQKGTVWDKTVRYDLEKKKKSG